MSRIKQMEVTIDQNDPNVTKTTGTAAVMTDIFAYKVPRSTVVLFRPTDILSAYFKDAGAETLGTDSFQLIARSPSGRSTEVLASGQYTTIKEFQDANKTKKLGQAHKYGPDWIIALQLKATTVTVVASNYFQLTCKQFTEEL